MPGVGRGRTLSGEKGCEMRRFLWSSLGVLLLACLLGGEAGSVATSSARIPSVSIVSFVTPVSGPCGIVAGSDGALWFTNCGNDTIGRITTSGSISIYRHPGISPGEITAGPDGALWFTNFGDVGEGFGSIGRVTTAGRFSFFQHKSISGPRGISVGPDGALWFTNSGSIGRARIAKAD
jgi:virginiamycin B lyase